MYDPNDTIIAVSSPSSEQRVIVRISGPNTLDVLRQIFNKDISGAKSGLIAGTVIIDPELRIDALLYLFLSPHSYTGEDIVEIHLYTNPAVTAAFVDNLLDAGLAQGLLRSAGPGEFTARAYLNGKIDLAKAEAVNEIIVSSNRYQLAAAETLLAGRLAETISEIRDSLMNCLSLIEAGLDFSTEDIEFISREDAVEILNAIKKKLNELLSGSISCESVMDLPSVGIAGAPNAGKSSLLNKLLGIERSIVSDQHKTTRDVLTGVLTLEHCKCVLFDCAGLIPSLVARRSNHEKRNILDELTQQAAIEALRNSDVIVFCIDIIKDNWAEDVSIRQLIEPETVIPIATKSDLLSEQQLVERLVKLKELFGDEFLCISSKTGSGIELLLKTIERNLIGEFKADRTSAMVLIARHKQAVTEAIDAIDESVSELKTGNDDVTAMMLRAAYQSISGIEHMPLRLPTQGGAAGQHIDDEILDRVFSRFCIGK